MIVSFFTGLIEDLEKLYRTSFICSYRKTAILILTFIQSLLHTNMRVKEHERLLCFVLFFIN